VRNRRQQFPCVGILRIAQYADNRDASCEAPNAGETRFGTDIARFVPNLNENLHLEQLIDFLDIFNARQPKAHLAEKSIAYKAASLLTKRAANLWLDRPSLITAGLSVRRWEDAAGHKRNQRRSSLKLDRRWFLCASEAFD
jgi:hypothetical protein